MLNQLSQELDQAADSLFIVDLTFNIFNTTILYLYNSNSLLVYSIYLLAFRDAIKLFKKIPIYLECMQDADPKIHYYLKAKNSIFSQPFVIHGPCYPNSKHPISVVHSLH